MGTTRFPGGVTNIAADAAIADLPIIDPSKYVVWFDDFVGYTAADWTVTETQAGATQAVADAVGGHLVVTNSAGATDACYLEWAAGETFSLETGKKLWLKTRLKLNDAAGDIINADWFVGLHVTSTTPLAAAQRVLLRSPDTTDDLILEVDDNSSEVDTTISSELAADTFYEVAIAWDGVDEITCWLDGVAVARQTAVANAPGASNPLAVGFGILNGEAVAKVMTIDYLLVVQER